MLLGPRQDPNFTHQLLIRYVYYDIMPDIASAIAREKQIKGWVRAKKVSLIESTNPDWLDLSAEWR